MSSENWCQSTPPPDDSDAVCLSVRVSSLCERGWRPLLMTGFLRDMLTRHFSSEGQIEYEDLRRYIWQPNQASGILIETVYRYVPEETEKRPAVLIARNDMTSNRIMLGDLSGQTGQGDGEYTITWIGSHTLFCIHSTGAGSEILSSEVARELAEFAPVIREDLGLLKFQVLEVGAISALEEARQNFVVPVTIGWAYTENWVLKADALPLRRVPVSIILTC
jgi:hypothetical protein